MFISTLQKYRAQILGYMKTIRNEEQSQSRFSIYQKIINGRTTIIVSNEYGSVAIECNESMQQESKTSRKYIFDILAPLWKDIKFMLSM
ncbi:MAG: hypothetical protein RL662_1071 [Bacteroidota bacterium]